MCHIPYTPLPRLQIPPIHYCLCTLKTVFSLGLYGQHCVLLRSDTFIGKRRSYLNNISPSLELTGKICSELSTLVHLKRHYFTRTGFARHLNYLTSNTTVWLGIICNCCHSPNPTACASAKWAEIEDTRCSRREQAVLPPEAVTSYDNSKLFMKFPKFESRAMLNNN